MAEHSLRIGIVGAGRIGRIHARHCAAHPRVGAVEVADPLGLPEELADGPYTAIPRFEPGRPPAWDAAIVAAPTSLHTDLVTGLLRAGIPTLCEKPLTRSVADTARLGALATELGVPLRVGLQRRFDAGLRVLRGLMRDGTLGRVLSVSAETCDPAPPPVAYLAQSGGVFLDMHIHDFDQVHWLLGEPLAALSAVGVAGDADWPDEVDDFGVTTVSGRTASGVAVSIRGSRWSGCGYDVAVKVVGRRGSAELDATGAVLLRDEDGDRLVRAGSGARPDGFIARFLPAYAGMVAGFLSEVDGAPAECASWLDDLTAVRAAAAATRSARTGTQVVPEHGTGAVRPAS